MQSQRQTKGFNPIIEDTDTFMEKPSELIEKQFIDEYFLLTRRVKGMGLTLKDFWEMDYLIFAQLLNNELEIALHHIFPKFGECQFVEPLLYM